MRTSILLENRKAADASASYRVVFHNNTGGAGYVYLYQTDPGANDPSVVSLVWFVAGSHSGTQVSFPFSLDYAMFWSAPLATSAAALVTGSVITTSQFLPCGLQSNNEVTFSHDHVGFFFKDQRTSTTQGIVIRQDANIPQRTAAIGTGMSGAAVFAVKAQPNLTTTFAPSLDYRIAWSSGIVTAGQVLDLNAVSAPQPVVFPQNLFTCTATLGADFSWEVSYAF